MTILVLGGSGFIGRNLIERLISEGHIVFNFDKFDSIINDKVTFLQGDFDNIQILNNVLSKADIVYHFISTTIPQTSIDDPKYCISSNVINTITLLDLCVKWKIKKIVFLSSGGTVYGNINESPISENHDLNPVCTYGISKLTIEKLLYMYKHLYGLNYLVFRVSNPYGKYQNPFAKQGIIAVFLGKIQRREKITIWGTGGIIRDYIYIDDLTEALLIAIKKMEKTGVYNIGSGIGYSILEIIQFMENVTRKTIDIDFEDARQLDIQVNVLNINKAIVDLGWNPKVPMEIGIAETWEWMNKRTSQN